MAEDIKSLSYEQTMSKLEKICEELQSGKLDLENAIAHFELGTKLRKYAQTKLASAKLRVQSINEEQSSSDFLDALHDNLREAVIACFDNRDSEGIKKAIQTYSDSIQQKLVTDKEL